MDAEQALALEPEHLSCYGLQYELTQKLETGRIQRLDEDLEARMYEHACDRLKQAGLIITDQQLGPSRCGVPA